MIWLYSFSSCLNIHHEKGIIFGTLGTTDLEVIQSWNITARIAQDTVGRHAMPGQLRTRLDERVTGDNQSTACRIDFFEQLAGQTFLLTEISFNGIPMFVAGQIQGIVTLIATLHAGAAAGVFFAQQLFSQLIGITVTVVQGRRRLLRILVTKARTNHGFSIRQGEIHATGYHVGIGNAGFLEHVFQLPNGALDGTVQAFVSVGLHLLVRIRVVSVLGQVCQNESKTNFAVGRSLDSVKGFVGQLIENLATNFGKLSNGSVVAKLEFMAIHEYERKKERVSGKELNNNNQTHTPACMTDSSYAPTSAPP